MSNYNASNVGTTSLDVIEWLMVMKDQEIVILFFLLLHTIVTCCVFSHTDNISDFIKKKMDQLLLFFSCNIENKWAGKIRWDVRSHASEESILF